MGGGGEQYIQAMEQDRSFIVPDEIPIKYRELEYRVREKVNSNRHYKAREEVKGQKTYLISN